jgi:DNA ligase-associated metallophosphoesterase
MDTILFSYPDRKLAWQAEHRKAGRSYPEISSTTNGMKIDLNGQLFLLLPEKAMLHIKEELLLLADLHLGKTHHFRKEGIPLSSDALHSDYEQLRALLDIHRPRKVYFLGDLFHSDYNEEWNAFETLIRSFPSVSFTLIKGNHDRIPKAKFELLNIHLIPHSLTENNICYSHKPEFASPGILNIAGHIHPGIKLYGPAKQSMVVPCFLHSGNTFVLPAFGKLTGLYLVERKENEVIYAIFPGKVERF